MHLPHFLHEPDTGSLYSPYVALQVDNGLPAPSQVADAGELVHVVFRPTAAGSG